MINDKNYITIQGWMTTKLNLKGNSLFIYAIIYGFSQDGHSKFHGSLEYLQEWTNSTRQGVIKVLKELIDTNLIFKEDAMPNNMYYVNPVYTNVNSVTTNVNLVNNESKQSLHNNIDNNIDNNKDIDNNAQDDKNSYDINKVISNNIKTVISYLNQVCHTSFRSSSATTKRYLKARFNEGFTVEDMCKVIDYKYDEWGVRPIKFSDGQLSSKYLRPSTLFSPKFENYLMEAKRFNKQNVVESVPVSTDIVDEVF